MYSIHSVFFIFLRQELEQIHTFSADKLNGLSDLLFPTLIDQCLQDTGVTTIRKRRLPMELMVWSVVGISLYRHLSMSKVVSQLDILLPGEKPFVAPSAVIHARKKLGHEPVEAVFNKTQQLWHEKTPHPDWHGLIDGVVWRTPDHSPTLFDRGFYALGLLHKW